ncbi:MAG TPA: ribosomal protein S18-alanine N-acetyltransferase [Candidatus Monoglobus merdigallinarum]|uniref:[Ribosomal protein bS18]-alanine N-acetyltransferase n=1 Tax=Candidatus Monoglobus merdigallinarum TaxID=2838698 RepID=A0A9D1TL82_9FIRM|nr:ribosomal protein S18-alanine N-acetyltransferase [Candidatus Monoglobus merdigallinarum]
MIKFKLLSSDDIGRVLEIERECFGSESWTYSMFESEIYNSVSLFLLAECGDGELAGYASLWVAAGIAEVANIAVAPDLRRKGIGECLMEVLTGISLVLGAELVNLEVKAANLGAVSMYSKLGFREVGLRRKYYPDGSDAVLMTKTLFDNKEPE